MAEAYASRGYSRNLGSCPKSVMAPPTLWMLELASERGFRQRSRHRVFAPAKAGNVVGAGFFDSLIRNARLSEPSESAPGAESAPGSSESRGIGVPKRVSARARAISRRHGRPVVLTGTHNSLMEKCLSQITLMGQEPKFGELWEIRSLHLLYLCVCLDLSLARPRASFIPPTTAPYWQGWP